MADWRTPGYPGDQAWRDQGNWQYVQPGRTVASAGGGNWTGRTEMEENRDDRGSLYGQYGGLRRTGGGGSGQPDYTPGPVDRGNAGWQRAAGGYFPYGSRSGPRYEGGYRPEYGSGYQPWSQGGRQLDQGQEPWRGRPQPWYGQGRAYQGGFRPGANEALQDVYGRGGEYTGGGYWGMYGGGFSDEGRRGTYWEAETNRGGAGAGWQQGYGSQPSGGRQGASGQQTGSRQQGSSWEGPYTGRGPKNSGRSDNRIMEDVADRLSQHGGIDAGDIEVEVSNGEVTLRGTVASRYQKREAENMAESVGGVRDVHNQLRIAPAETVGRTPTVTGMTGLTAASGMSGTPTANDRTPSGTH